MRVLWTSDGLDPVNLFLFLAVDHPLAALAATATLAWAYFAVADNPLQGISTGRDGAAALDRELPAERGAALARILSSDPGFTAEAFVRRATAAFAEIDEGWNRRDMSRARAFVSDGVFERFSRQRAEHEARGVRPRIGELRLGESEVLGYVSGPHFDAVYVSFKGSVVEELVTVEGEDPVSGGREDFVEVWTFLRRPGVETLTRPGPIEGRCPSCGAPLEIGDAASCAACKAWVNSGEYDWVLTAVTKFAAWAFPSPDREVTGWTRLRQSDPELSLEALEDRAAVVFWRWLDARRRAEPAPLRGVSSDAFFGAFSPDASFERDVVVLGVETTAFQLGREFDRAHVQVSWEGEQLRRVEGAEPLRAGRDTMTSFFILRRRAGATSAVKAGLRTARCPGCGAAPEEADTAVCAYCGRAFNDDETSWVLEDVVPFGRWRRPE